MLCILTCGHYRFYLRQQVTKTNSKCLQVDLLAPRRFAHELHDALAVERAFGGQVRVTQGFASALVKATGFTQ